MITPPERSDQLIVGNGLQDRGVDFKLSGRDLRIDFLVEHVGKAAGYRDIDARIAFVEGFRHGLPRRRRAADIEDEDLDLGLVPLIRNPAAYGLPPGTLSSNVNIFASRPHSRRLNQADLNADYALLPGHNVALGYRWQGLQRHCHATWIDCENAATSIENTLRAEWRATWLEELGMRVAYAFANRSE